MVFGECEQFQVHFQKNQNQINASQIYFRLKDISDSENFLSKIRGFVKLQKKKKKSKPCGMFFQFLMLKMSSIKELLYKTSEIQWNITETLPEKLKRKISWALPCKILPPEITKKWGIAFFGGWVGKGVGYFGGLGSNVEFNGFSWFYEFLKFPASIFWLKTVLTLD